MLKMPMFVNLVTFVWIVAVDLLQMLEFNMNVTFPVASFFTVILALVGEYSSLFLFHSCKNHMIGAPGNRGIRNH